MHRTWVIPNFFNIATLLASLPDPRYKKLSNISEHAASLAEVKDISKDTGFLCGISSGTGVILLVVV